MSNEVQSKGRLCYTLAQRVNSSPDPDSTRRALDASLLLDTIEDILKDGNAITSIDSTDLGIQSRPHGTEYRDWFLTMFDVYFFKPELKDTLG